MEATDPLSSMEEFCRLSPSQESQFSYSLSDQSSGEDDLGSGEISSATSETDAEEEEDGCLFHTPPEASYSVSDNDADVFHTPTRASSTASSPQEVQQQQPEEIFHGSPTGESVGDSEETVPIAVDLGADADLEFCLAPESGSAGMNGCYPVVDLPAGVDQTGEMEVIHRDSVKSRVSEDKSILNDGIRESLVRTSTTPELTKTMRIIRLKESLHKLNSLSKKQNRWKKDSSPETGKASVGTELNCMPEEKLQSNLVSLDMNVVDQDASIDCSEASWTFKKKNDGMVYLQDDRNEDNDKVDDGRFCGGKRKLEFGIEETESNSEETNAVLEYNLDALKHTVSKQACNYGDEQKATKNTIDFDEFVSVPPADDDTVDKHILQFGTSVESKDPYTKLKKKSRPANKGFAALEILKMLAQDYDNDPRLESMSLIDIAKMRGMTFP